MSDAAAETGKKKFKKLGVWIDRWMELAVQRWLKTYAPRHDYSAVVRLLIEAGLRAAATQPESVFGPRLPTPAEVSPPATDSETPDPWIAGALDEAKRVGEALTRDALTMTEEELRESSEAETDGDPSKAPAERLRAEREAREVKMPPTKPTKHPPKNAPKARGPSGRTGSKGSEG
jgi:hypothetical protein